MSGIATAAGTATLIYRKPFSAFRKNILERKRNSSNLPLQTIYFHGLRSERREKNTISCYCIAQRQISQDEWNWERWQQHFREMDELESTIAVLKCQLEDAVNVQDFGEASRLKKSIEIETAKDVVAEIMHELKKSIEEERYRDAVRIQESTGAGLVGWWAGLSKGSEFSFGQIIHIFPARGRFLAKSYHPRLLGNKELGVPVFEIFVTKDGHNKYKLQAVYLRRSRASSNNSAQITEAADDKLLGSSVTVPLTERSDISPDDSVDQVSKEDKKVMDLTDDGISRVLNFLWNQIPGLKFKIFKVVVPEEGEVDRRILEELIQTVDEAEDDEVVSDAETDVEVTIEGLEDTGSGDVEIVLDEKTEEMPPRFMIEGVLQRDLDMKTSAVPPVRVPARLEVKGRDYFVFLTEKADRKQEIEGGRTAAPETMNPVGQSSTAEAPDVAKVQLNVGLSSSKVVKDIKEIIKFAMSQARTRDDVFENIAFHRINNVPSADRLAGLYIGASAFNVSEIVELRRKYGQWKDDGEANGKDADLKFFEYVEAVKLSGDLFVPAGEVVFRAKLTKDNCSPNPGYYPEELGVIQRYKGQGRIAKAGFSNPQWIDGELLLLDGKGTFKGTKLGFFYSTPGPHLLKLFNRLKFPE